MTPHEKSHEGLPRGMISRKTASLQQGRLLVALAMVILLPACALTGQPRATARPSAPVPTSAVRTPAPSSDSPIATPTDTPSASSPLSPVPTPFPEPTSPPTATPVALAPLTVDVDALAESDSFDATRMLNSAVGGYAPMANVNWLPDAYGELAAIRMDMIRHDHLNDDEVYSVVWRGSGSDLNYDFSRLDRVVVPVLQNGMRPLMCLSYKADVLEPRDESKRPIRARS